MNPVPGAAESGRETDQSADKSDAEGPDGSGPREAPVLGSSGWIGHVGNEGSLPVSPMAQLLCG